MAGELPLSAPQLPDHLRQRITTAYSKLVDKLPIPLAAGHEISKEIALLEKELTNKTDSVSQAFLQEIRAFQQSAIEKNWQSISPNLIVRGGEYATSSKNFLAFFAILDKLYQELSQNSIENVTGMMDGENLDRVDPILRELFGTLAEKLAPRFFFLLEIQHSLNQVFDAARTYADTISASKPDLSKKLVESTNTIEKKYLKLGNAVIQQLKTAVEHLPADINP